MHETTMTRMESPQAAEPASDIAQQKLTASGNDPLVETGAVVAPAVPRRARRRWLMIPRWIAAAASALFLVGLFVRLTIADRMPVASTIYYATPWSLLALLAAFVTIAAHLRKQRSLRRWWAAAAIICAATWLWTSCFHSAGQVEPGNVRVIVWNMSHGSRGLPGIVASLAALNPDIAILIEADPQKVAIRETFVREFPNHHVSLLGAGMVLVSRWPTGDSIPYHVGDAATESRIREIDVHSPWGLWTVFTVDLGSNPFYSRREHLRELARLIDRRGDRPVIVGGDFNTPLDSDHYEQLRNLGLREMFLTAGEGYLPTWPVPAPVLSLDQIWVNDQLTPVRCEREWDWRSDHAAVVGTLAPHSRAGASSKQP
jgi:endonuclease/exonuclease/phosphatase (EEP) superfamily protein YafD